LSAFEGQVPVEMFGRVDFPVIRAMPWPISLGPHAFLWFELERAEAAAADVGFAGRDLPRLPGAVDLRGLVAKRTIGRFTDVLESWVRERRWFRGKARKVTSAEIVDWFDVPLADRAALAVVLTVSFAEGDPDQYLVPVMAVAPDEATQLTTELPGAAIATIGDRPELTLVDAMRVPAFADALLELVARRRTLRGAHGQLAGRPARSFAALRGSPGEPLHAVPSRAEQSNSSVVLGDRLMLKLYRRLEGARSTDLEVALFLTNQGFPNVPPVAGSIEYRRPGGEVSSAAILSGFVPNEGTLWEVTVDGAADYLERAAAERLLVETAKVPSAVLLADAAGDLRTDARESVGAYLDTAWLLGRRTGDMHMALGRGEDDPAFAPETFTALYQRSLYQSIRAAVRTNLALLARRVEKLPAGVREIAERVLANEAVIDQKSRTLVGRRLGGKRIRIHGDYHLGQVLHTGRDIAIIDFEGEPGRPIGERRLKRSPLTDVASMLRSFDYAAREATVRAVGTAAVRDEDAERTEGWARQWYRSVSATFLRGYREATGGSDILPVTDQDWAILLDALVIQKAIYELDYELNNRPDWVGLPLRGILELVEP
jgi:maltose alpha-D-glucosyltransferase/alpha-amylase